LARVDDRAKLVIIGEGPQRERLEELANALGVADRVEFVRWLSREELFVRMSSAEVLLFPSFEGGGMVVLEAMANGLPVVCLDFGGPATMISSECGIAVVPQGRCETIAALSSALRRLAADDQLRLGMATAARRRVASRFMWCDRHEAVAQWYQTALSVDGETVHSRSNRYV
jgi:glycosyltransferase involved in cell wall biosynthesis